MIRMGKGPTTASFVKNGKDKIYFDSYGLPPPTELLKYLGDPGVLQQRTNTTG